MTPELAATKEVAELARPLLGPPVKQLSELLADRVRLWRWKSAIGIMKRAREIREEEGLQANEVSLKFFLPFIEEASKEDEKDELLSDLWARLLARADKTTTGFDLVCIDILKAMGPIEALLLRTLLTMEGKFEDICKGTSTTGKMFRQRLEMYPGGGPMRTDVLEDIVVRKLNIPAVDILERPTMWQKEFQYAISSLSKLGLIEEHDWRVDRDVFALLEMRLRGDAEYREPGFVGTAHLATRLGITHFGGLFLTRCGNCASQKPRGIE